jgi:hypothetical protein
MQSIFYIDGPGDFFGVLHADPCQAGGNLINSLESWVEFKVTFTNKVTNAHRSFYYNTKIVINPGPVPDYQHSVGNNGTLVP